MPESSKNPARKWQQLKPWALQEPRWLAFIAKLTGAQFALAAVLAAMMANFLCRSGGPETLIQGTVASTYECNHRDCRRGRWILYVENHDGLVSVPGRDVFRRLEAAGKAPVRILATGDLAREIYLGSERILARSQAENYQRGMVALMGVAVRWLLAGGLLAWFVAVTLRLLRQ